MQKVGICRTWPVVSLGDCSMYTWHTEQLWLWYNPIQEFWIGFEFCNFSSFFFFKHSFFTPTYPLPAPVFSPWKCPSPFIPQTRWLIIAIVCWSAKKKNTLGRVFIKRHTCLTFGQQNGKSTPAVFLLSTALVSAEYTCSCGNVNLHERVVS